MIDQDCIRRLSVCVTLTMVLMCLAANCSAQQRSGTFELPSDPTQWVNSGPVSLDLLKGKAAVLWFYEESCPTCREKWPPLLALAKKYEGQPVMFIGVNSGNPRPVVEQYARGVGCSWPMIVDATREFEKQCEITPEISLQNIHQIGYIDSSGKFHQGRCDQVESTISTALNGAKWKVDPSTIPVAMQSAWQAIEFGNPAPAATTVKKGLVSLKPDLREAATKLNDVVQAEIKPLLERAKEAEASADKWQAYVAYRTVVNQYGGYDLPLDARAAMKTLAGDEQVKKQVVAEKTLETLTRQLNSESPSSRRGALIRLKKLVQDYAGTDAAKEAQQLLDESKE